MKSITSAVIWYYKQYEAKETPDGKQTVFSIKFVKKDGDLFLYPWQ